MIELTGEVFDQVLNWLKSQYFGVNTNKLSPYSSLVGVEFFKLFISFLSNCLLLTSRPLIYTCDWDTWRKLVILLDKHVQISESTLPALLEELHEFILGHNVIAIFIHDLERSFIVRHLSLSHAEHRKKNYTEPMNRWYQR
jgi:hypothetical protein